YAGSATTVKWSAAACLRGVARCRALVATAAARFMRCMTYWYCTPQVTTPGVGVCPPVASTCTSNLSPAENATLRPVTLQVVPLEVGVQLVAATAVAFLRRVKVI